MFGGRLVLAIHKVLGEAFEGVGRCSEGVESGEGACDEIASIGERTVDAIDGGPCGFCARGILAGGLSELAGHLGDVEDVVHDLEGEAGILAEGSEAIDGVVGSAGEVAASDDGDGDEGSGFCAVDLLDKLGCGRMTFGLEIDDLAADHAGGEAGEEVAIGPGGQGPNTGSDGAGDLAKDFDGGGGGAVQAGDRVKREGLEGISGEDRDGLSEDFMAGGLAAAEVVVIEGWEVIVDERVRVQHFDGGTEIGGSLFPLAVRGAHAPGLEAEDGAEPFAACEDTVAHGAMDGVRGGVGRGKKAIEGAIGALSAGVNQVLDGRAHRWSMISAHSAGDAGAALARRRRMEVYASGARMQSAMAEMASPRRWSGVVR